jgi:hypothetical protein
MWRTWIILLLFSLVMSHVPSDAAEVTVSLDMVSAYVFRGITYNDGPCLQPYLETAAGDITFALWANFDLNEYEYVKAGDFSEVDFTLAYQRTLGMFDLSAGVMQFLFPEAGPHTNTRELFGSASTALFGGVGGSVYVGYDIDEIEDIYTSMLLLYNLPVRTPAVAISFSVGYVGKNTSTGHAAGFHEYAVTCRGSTPIARNVELTVHATYTDGLDQHALPEQDIEIFGGLSIACSF